MPRSVARQKAKNVIVGAMETLGLGVAILFLMLIADWTYDAMDEPSASRSQAVETFE